jgi:hypothetical protein
MFRKKSAAKSIGPNGIAYPTPKGQNPAMRLAALGGVSLSMELSRSQNKLLTLRQTRTLGDVSKPFKKYSGKAYTPYNPFKPRVIAIEPTGPKPIKMRYPHKEGWRRMYKRVDKRTGYIKNTMLNSNTGRMALHIEGEEACALAAAIAWRAVELAMQITLPFRVKDHMAEAAAVAMACKRDMTHFLTNRMRELVDILWASRSRVLQAQVDVFCSGKVKDVHFDCFNRKLVMEDPINFVGGKAQIVPEDLEVRRARSVCVYDIYMSVRHYECMTPVSMRHVSMSNSMSVCYVSMR